MQDHSPSKANVRQSAAIAAFVTLGLAVHAQVTWPAWPPRGADWSLWYSSAAWLFHDVEWPAVRWPLWGVSVGLLDLLVPGPLFVAAMVSSMLFTGVAAGATWGFVRPVAGPGAALAGVALLVLHPASLQMGSWLGAYTMWAATAPLAAAALAAATRHDSAAAWRWVGIVLAVMLAVQEKGILTAVGLAPAVLMTLGIAGREGLRPRVVGLLAPVAALALAYAVFPQDLSSLDAQASAQMTGPGDAQAMGPPLGGAIFASVPMPPPPPKGAPRTPRMEDEGWIFGKQMGPTVMLGLASSALRTLPVDVQAARARKVDLVFRESFPGAGPWLLPLLGFTALAALSGAIVRARPGPGGAGRPDALVGVVALLGVGATALPALRTDFNLRYILAPMWAVPAVAAIALGIATDGALDTLARLVPSGRTRALGLLRPWLRAAVPLAAGALILGPLRVPSTWDYVGSPLLEVGRETESLSAQVWYDLKAGWPDAVIDVHRPIAGGMLAIDGRKGRFLGEPDLADAQTEPDRWLLVVTEPGAGAPTVGQTAETLGLPSAPALALPRRRIAAVWRKQSGEHLVLLEPV